MCFVCTEGVNNEKTRKVSGETRRDDEEDTYVAIPVTRVTTFVVAKAELGQSKEVFFTAGTDVFGLAESAGHAEQSKEGRWTSRGKKGQTRRNRNLSPFMGTANSLKALKAFGRVVAQAQVGIIRGYDGSGD